MKNDRLCNIIWRNGDYLVIQQLAAEICGVSIPTFQRWCREADGPQATEDKLYSIRALGEWCRNYQIKKPGRGKFGDSNFPYCPDGWGPLNSAPQLDGSNKENRSEADTRLKVAQANKIEVELAEKAGQLIPVDEVASAWQQILVRVKTRLLKLPTTLAPLVHGDPDMYSIQRKLQDGVNDALTEASVDWRDGHTQEGNDDNE